MFRLESIFLFNAVIFWFHVNFQGCTPQKTDIVAENGRLEDESFLGFRPTAANC